MTVRMLCRPSTAGSTAWYSNSLPPSSASSGLGQHDAAFAAINTPGVVVVGVVGRDECELSQLLNRIIDSPVFGSRAKQIFSNAAGSNTKLGFEGIIDRLKHYYDEEKGLVYVMFSWGTSFPDLLRMNNSDSNLALLMEQLETTSLRVLLFMFSVCHILLFVQDAARFEPQLLRDFRVLQAAKSSMAPFIKTHVLPSIIPPSSSRGHSARPIISSGRGGTRHAISLMSGSAPTTLFPGQCVPVLLFICLEDFLDTVLPNEDSMDHNTSPNSRIIARNSSPVHSVTRASSKTEYGVRKKFQSSVEGQVRFLIKKCRTVLGFGDGSHGGGSGMGPRGSGINSVGGAGGSGGSGLFTMDASRVVLFVERPSNKSCDALEAASNVLEGLLQGNCDERALWDLGNGVGEDIQSVRDFVWRQAEILRGRGAVCSNSSGVGVGMVAAAAAAAAASAASGTSGAKPISNPPELPTLTNWLTASNLILTALMRGESKAVDILADETPSGHRRKIPHGENDSLGSIEAAITCLESGMGMDMKFSAAWCRKTLPSAQEVYLKGLPQCYPTALHTAQLENSLRYFRSMVRGPAVDLFSEKLKNGCEKIWKSGRQLCDAVSLTGKPCIHEVHEEAKSHSSGVVFLHACACGRSRRLREDPFDYEYANVTFFRFPKCEELLASVVLPNAKGNIPFGGCAWSLVRLGSGRYYQPLVGVLQSGFCADRNFLFQWDIRLVSSSNSDSVKDSQELPPSNLMLKNGRHNNDVMMRNEKKISAVEESIYQRSKAESRKALPFSSSKASYSEDTAFPPLPQKQERSLPSPKPTPAKTKQLVNKQKRYWQLHDSKDTSKANDNNSNTITNSISTNENVEIDGATVSSSHTLRNTTIPSTRGEHVSSIYVGFEYECSQGHRYFLSSEQLKNIDMHKTKSSSSTSSSSSSSSSTAAAAATVAASVPATSTSSSNKELWPALKSVSSSAASLSELTEAIQDLKIVGDSGEGHSLLNSNLPIYITCPYCHTANRRSNPKLPPNTPISVSQLQRVFMVTPPLPLILATCPVVQFEEGPKSEFRLECEVVLPADSFLVLRLPFVYCATDVSHPLLYNSNLPHHSAYLLKGTSLYLTRQTDH